MTTLGYDFSEWQDSAATIQDIDFNKSKSAGAQFVIGRSSYGMIPDRIFQHSFDDAKAAGLIVGAYDFGDYRTYAALSVQAFKKHLGGRKPDFNCLDLENNDTYWPGFWPGNGANLTAWVWDWLTAYKIEGFTQKALLYTNPDTVKQMRGSLPLLERIAAEMPLWLTWWDAGAPLPEHYKPWTKCTIIQPRPSAVGKQFGVESGNLDLDNWQGTLDELKAFISQPVVVNPITSPPGEVIDAGARARLAELEKWARSMPRF